MKIDMLTKFEKDIVEIIKCSLNGQVPQTSDDFNVEDAYNFAQEMQITPLIYYGLAATPNFTDSIEGKKFLKSTMIQAYISSNQMELIQLVSSEFKNGGIEFLKLKGTLLKEMYPYPEMRVMSDADILIKTEQYELIKPIMVNLGFEEVPTESDHELVWKNGDFILELHKRLIPSYNKDYYSYFGEGWRLARKLEGSSEYVMNNEDNFIYLFTHLAKHYRDSGIGIKHLTDFYVFFEKNKNLDWNYIENELAKLQLLEFWKNIHRLLDAWFKNSEWDDISVFLTKKFFINGVYGNEENQINSEALKLSKSNKNGIQIKREKTIYLIFLPYERMCVRFPFLKKAPVLLPIMWVWRWIDAILFRRKNIKAKKNRINMISQEGINKYHNELKYVGLDFNFDED